MTTPQLMDQLRFDRLAPGTYGKAPPPKLFRSLEALSVPTRSGDLSRGGLTRGGDWPQTFGVPTRGGGFKGLDFLSADPEPTKPEEIIRLEQVLTAAYGTPAQITSVSDSRSARKQVREVNFYTDGGVSKVWVFNASPAETLRELKLYHLISKHTAVRTARPIGFEPKSGDTSYPYEIAILGGIVEHAGESYNALLRRLNLAPQHVAGTSLAIARMIPAYQLPLTAAQAEFATYGIDVPEGGPRRELTARLLAALHREPAEAEGLLRACEELAAAQESLRVISHGDLHTGNIVTVAEQDPLGFSRQRTDQFGIIDWGSLSLDHPYADLLDFWVHHERAARWTLISKEQASQYHVVRAAADDAYRESYRHFAQQAEHPQPPAPLDWEIQHALWHIYELFDPLRTDATDIQRKSEYHAAALGQSLDTLANLGRRTETDAVRKELLPLLASHPTLQPLITSQH